MGSVGLKKRLTLRDATTGFPKFPADDPDLCSAINWSRREGNLLQSINKTLQWRHEPAMNWKNHPVTFFSDLLHPFGNHR